MVLDEQSLEELCSAVIELESENTFWNRLMVG